MKIEIGRSGTVYLWIHSNGYTITGNNSLRCTSYQLDQSQCKHGNPGKLSTYLMSYLTNPSPIRAIFSRVCTPLFLDISTPSGTPILIYEISDISLKIKNKYNGTYGCEKNEVKVSLTYEISKLRSESRK